MFNYLYKIYPRLFGDYKVLYMDTDSIYAKLNISHDEYLKILEENRDLFGKNIGQNESEYTNNPIKVYHLNVIRIFIKTILKIIKIN